MYEMSGAGSGLLATTGVAMATGWIAAWTLLVAGAAVLSIARVLRHRRDERSAGTR